MTRTYYIRFHNCFGEEMWDKIKYTSPEDRPRFHKVEALQQWKQSHPGHGRMTILNHVFTREEWKQWMATH